MKITVQRQAIFDYLKDNTSHPSATDIYKAVSEKIMTISFASVYNTLSLMKENGLIRELAITNKDHKRYDSNMLPHAHLVCAQCGTIVDLDLPFPAIHIPDEQKQGFEIRTDEIYIYARCPACLDKGHKTSTLQIEDIIVN